MIYSNVVDYLKPYYNSISLKSSSTLLKVWTSSIRFENGGMNKDNIKIKKMTKKWKKCKYQGSLEECKWQLRTPRGMNPLTMCLKAQWPDLTTLSDYSSLSPPPSTIHGCLLGQFLHARVPWCTFLRAIISLVACESHCLLDENSVASSID